MRAPWSLALVMLLRDWRAGEFRLLLVAMVIAVASLCSVSFFADRVRLGLEQQAHQLLGADLLLMSDKPWRGEVPAAFQNAQTSQGIAIGEIQTFVSMARGLDLGAQAAVLASVKAVDAGYPLRGSLQISRAGSADSVLTRDVPPIGSVWIDERLAASLGLQVGQSLGLGQATFKVDALLTYEPDRGLSFFNIAPRLLMRRADIASTGLIQEASRASYQLVAAGPTEKIVSLRAQVKDKLSRGQRMENLESARPEVRQSLDRARVFLGLCALLAVVLAAVAIALATQRYTERHLDACAVLRCLGASQGLITRLFLFEFLIFGFGSSVLGVVLGYGAQEVLAQVLGGLLEVQLPAASMQPVWGGLALGVVVLIGFALPPLLALKNVSALRVLRRDFSRVTESMSARMSFAAGLAAMAVLLVWQAGELALGLYALGGFCMLFGVFALAARYGVALLGRLGGVGKNVSWRYGLASLARRQWTSGIQVVALAVGMTAIVLLTVTRSDLLTTWQQSMPADAPNRFLLNVQPEQREQIVAHFREKNLAPPVFSPMVRARLTHINSQPVKADDYRDERARRLVEREFNLSYTAQLPQDNRIVAGRWFSPADSARAQFSVEQGLAKTLGLSLGDQLTYQVAGESFTAQVSSLRQLDWSGMRVNFFVIAAPGLIDTFPASYISAFRLNAGAAQVVNQLIQNFPNLTVVDISAIADQLQSVLTQVSSAIQYVFVFSLLAGFCVLFAALQSSQDQRLRECAIMRTLGASRTQLLRAQLSEFAAIGALAGALAAIGAGAMGWLISSLVLNMPYQYSAWSLLVGPAVGAIVVLLAAWPGVRTILRQTPMAALRALG